MPQRGVKPWPLTIRASILSLEYQDTCLLSHSSLQGESMTSCISSSEITLATKCYSGSNKLVI